MIRGLYTAASGMMLQMARQDVVANNLANVCTSGYKKETVIAGEFPEMLLNCLGENRENDNKIAKKPGVTIGRIGTGACIAGITTDFSTGSFKKTDIPTDLAIGNPGGYFVVETPQGEAFTRNGEFKINYDGLLTTNQGYPVLDYYDDYIYIDGEFSVNSTGSVIVEGEELTRLKVVNFENLHNLKKTGDSLFVSNNEEHFILDNPEILQGYLEESNVNAVKEMVTLINVARSYESLQKIVQAEDETIKVAVDEVGNIR